MQFFPCVALPLIFVLLACRSYTGTAYWFVGAGFYVLAKLLEHFDAAIYRRCQVMSGHALKHVGGGLSSCARDLCWRLANRVGRWI